MSSSIALKKIISAHNLCQIKVDITIREHALSQLIYKM